ncbi:MAG: tetratricopeptide repeat protein [Candidatus Electrothrix sp. GM3_4]|nr:tetratricopeptide repeat protein [Candidatus Electrothrix sp. GM3_4]
MGIGDKDGEGVTLSNLAWLRETQGRYTEAELLYRQAIFTLKEILPVDHRHIVTVRANYDRVKRILEER